MSVLIRISHENYVVMESKQKTGYLCTKIVHNRDRKMSGIVLHVLLFKNDISVFVSFTMLSLSVTCQSISVII